MLQNGKAKNGSTLCDNGVTKGKGMHDIQLAGWYVAQAGDISVFGLFHHRCTVTCTVCFLASLVSIRSSNRMRVVAKTLAYCCSEFALQSTNNSSGTGTNNEARKRDNPHCY